jgi:c-di-GMP phosphodiesterase
MPDVFVARQPIYNRSLDVVAYELLFRDSDGGQAVITDSEAATSKVILNSFTEIGLENIVGNRRAFINVSKRFLLEGSSTLLDLLPANRIVLELLEDVEPDEELLDVLRNLSAQKYTLALDDFTYDESLQCLVDVARIVKLDMVAMDRPAVEEHVARLRPLGLKLLAEKVETHDDFEFCKGVGFDYYQGYFFCKPKTISGRSVATNQLIKLRLMSQLQAADVGFDELEDIISCDVGLSYRLLRYINSAFFSLPREVASIRQALVLLGQRNIRKWATLLVLADVDNDKPHELMVTGLIRARMCELVGQARGGLDADTYFTTGLFSVVDAMMDSTMEAILGELPLSEDIRQALLDHSGPAGEVLHAVLAFERGDIGEVAESLRTNAPLQEAYLQAVAWAREVSGGLPSDQLPAAA